MWMPTHPVYQAYGMTHDHFCFLWQHFHLVEQDVTEDEIRRKKMKRIFFSGIMYGMNLTVWAKMSMMKRQGIGSIKLSHS